MVGYGRYSHLLYGPLRGILLNPVKARLEAYETYECATRNRKDIRGAHLWHVRNISLPALAGKESMSFSQVSWPCQRRQIQLVQQDELSLVRSQLAAVFCLSVAIGWSLNDPSAPSSDLASHPHGKPPPHRSTHEKTIPRPQPTAHGRPLAAFWTALAASRCGRGLFCLGLRCLVTGARKGRPQPARSSSHEDDLSRGRHRGSSRPCGFG